MHLAEALQCLTPPRQAQCKGYGLILAGNTFMGDGYHQKPRSICEKYGHKRQYNKEQPRSMEV